MSTYDSAPSVPAWFFEERAHAGDEHLDPGYVASYDRKAATDPAEDLVLLRDLGLHETSTLVDLGAGTGALALAAAPYCRRVVAVDISPAMLALLNERVGQLGLHNLEVAQGGFLSYAHSGEAADFVYSRHALHHLPDFWKAIALARVATMLRPGGVLYLRDLLFSCDVAEVGRYVEAWLARASLRADLGWTRPELEEHLRQEHSTFTWLLEPMLDRAGFDIRHADYDEASRIYTAYTCVKR
jgi:ubiquinone/menaquinone biosynthesis C-methylase UbiE